MKFWIKNNYDETAVLNGCRNGNSKSQELLYKTFAPTMFAICLRYSADYPQAEDMLQEGFIKVFQNIGKFRSEGSFEGWLKRIFVNTALEWLRKNGTMNKMMDVEYFKDELIQEDAFHELSKNDLMRLIQSLSAGYRTVFNLYAIEGYTHKEIGNMLGISEGTSKSQFARARYILQRMVIHSNKTRYAAAVL